MWSWTAGGASASPASTLKRTRANWSTNGGNTYVDYNRGGVPLIEIVSEPDIRSVEEAREYMEKLQLIMRCIGVSDCKMQEGSMRSDVNISLRPVGSDTFGTRTEIKNMNSFTYMEKAMRYEIERQTDILDSGEKVVQDTLRYLVDEDRTEPMRSKEDAHDYRYFREPDLVTIAVSPELVEELREALPELPDDRKKTVYGRNGPARRRRGTAQPSPPHCRLL